MEKTELTKSDKKKLLMNFSKESLLSYWWVLLLIIPLVVTIIIRLEPMNLAPIEKSAESGFYSYYRSLIKVEVDKQFPNLPKEGKDALVEEKFQEFINTTDKEQISSQIKRSAEAMKSKLQYSSGSKTYPYLGDIDSYYWLRQSRNIIEKGMQCDMLINKTCYDTYTTAPHPLGKGTDYYPIVIVWSYKALSIFIPDMSLMQASFLTPLILSVIYTIPLFLLIRKIGGNIAAVTGTILVNVNPHVLTRSLGSDSDIVNVFFQIIFLWIAVECFYSENEKAKSFWAALAGLSLSIYSLFWMGWWYLADLFIISIAVKFLFVFFKQLIQDRKINTYYLKDQLIKLFTVLLAFLGSLIFFYGFLFHSFSGLWQLTINQFHVFSFKIAANPNYWPNVLTTVAEFNSLNLSEVISSYGRAFGISFYLIALLGIAFLVFPSIKFIKTNKFYFLIFILCTLLIFAMLKPISSGIPVFLIMAPVLAGIALHLFITDKKFHPDVVFLFSIIICFASYFSTVGARFVFLMAIPISILASLFIINLSGITASLMRSILSFPRFFSKLFVIIVCVVFVIAPIKSGFAVAQNYLPMVTDEWVETLEHIRAGSKPDAIINSWWDFGHWFKYFADRRVTLDGSSQNNPQLHWLGKLLLTSDEKASIGILQMLDCGGNMAFNEINKKINDTPHSIDILNKILTGDKEEAAEILKNHSFSGNETSSILSLTHCNPPENFLITSVDMVGKAGVWGHFGSWDFKKAYLSRIISVKSKNEIVREFMAVYNIAEPVTNKWIDELKSIKDESQINSWIAPWPGYYSGFNSCQNKGNIFVCPFSQGETKFDINVDFNNKSAYVNAAKRIYPESTAFADDDSFSLVNPAGETFPVGVLFVKKGNNLHAMYMDPVYPGSMFTRLFFVDGLGLSSFEKFYDATTVFGERIITWKVKWN